MNGAKERDKILFFLKELTAGQHSDPCHSQKNAVKVACKDDSTPPYSKPCADALDALNKCMNEQYQKTHRAVV